MIVTGVKDVEDFFKFGRRCALESGEMPEWGKVVLVAGVPIGVTGGTNLLYVMDLSSGSDSDPE